MNQGLLPRRYAKALYKFAVENKCEEEVYRLMKNLRYSFDKEPAIAQTVANPFVSDAEKLELLITAAQASVADKCYSDFLQLLAENDRIAMAGDIALAYIAIYRAEKHIYRVEVVTADTLPHETVARLRALIEKHLKGGSMEYSERVDAGLIGGFVINIDNEQLDASVRSELKQLRLKLLSK